MVSITVNTGWRGAGGFCTIFRCMRLVAFDATGWFTAVVGRVAKGLTIETLFHSSGVFKFFPFDEAMT